MTTCGLQTTLTNDDVADHAETGLAPRNGLLRRWRLHNRFACPAGELRPNVAHDLEDDGLDIERLIGVLAETAKSAATSRTNAIAACRQVNDLLRGRWGGIARSGVFRWWLIDAARGGNSASAVSSSSSASSSWVISLASFSEERPKCIRFNRAI